MRYESFDVISRIRHWPVDGDKRYVDVVLLDTEKDLNAFLTHALNRKRLARKVAGAFLTFPTPRNRIGVIALCEQHLVPNAISHEASHAVWEIARRFNIPLDDHKREEWFCTTLGHLVGSIHANWPKSEAPRDA